MKYTVNRKSKLAGKKRYKKLKEIHKKSTKYTHVKKRYRLRTQKGKFISKTQNKQLFGTGIFLLILWMIVGFVLVLNAQAKEMFSQEQGAGHIEEHVSFEQEELAYTKQVVETSTSNDWHMPKDQMRAYVLERFELEGIDPNKMDRIIQCESSWNINAINMQGNVAGKDHGLYQINDYFHGKYLSVEDMYDIEKSTAYAISLVKKQGFKPWVCAKILGIK